MIIFLEMLILKILLDKIVYVDKKRAQRWRAELSIIFYIDSEELAFLESVPRATIHSKHMRTTFSVHILIRYRFIVNNIV